jgi:hypothetical protein
MGVAKPDIFNITVCARTQYSATRESALDVEVGMQYSAKVLHYIIHIILSDHHLHHPRTANLPIDDATHMARLNFSRLLRQVDVNNLLPETPLGIVRQVYPLGPFPMPEVVRLQWSRLHSQRQSLEAVLRDHQTDFILYESNFGVNEIVSWPTFSVVLPSLTSSKAGAIIEDIRIRFDPFSYTVAAVRLVEGRYLAAGQAWYYPKVPIAASISRGNLSDVPRAGTFGCSVVNSSNGDVLGLTAGHVLSRSDDGLVYAPAHKPFSEAEQIVKIGIRMASDNPKALDAWARMKERMDECKRQLGSIVLADVDVVATECIDIGVFSVDEDRRADNRLRTTLKYTSLNRTETN